MRALVVIPTYDERHNLGRLLPAVLAQHPDLHVLVVDDASPDGTGALADAMAAAEPRIHVLHRPRKLGLGTAYLDAFRWALARSAELVIQMDADFSHDPAAIGSFLDAVTSADVVVGSRYLDGIRLLNWPLYRLVLSVVANRYAALVTGVPIHDLTSGYKCFRRGALEQIAHSAIRSDGYAFQIETTVACWRRGLRVREIPIVFADRLHGRSKLSRRIVFEAAWIVLALGIGRAHGTRLRRGAAAEPRAGDLNE